jgi:DNA polymerase-1
MIYLVTGQKDFFGLEGIEYVSTEESLKMLKNWSMIQFDSETNGKDAHLCDFLCVQFGDIEGNNQIVVDTTSVDIRLYKDILEKHYIVGQNLKFDLQFLFNYGIVPRKVYDTMIVEQF